MPIYPMPESVTSEHTVSSRNWTWWTRIPRAHELPLGKLTHFNSLPSWQWVSSIFHIFLKTTITKYDAHLQNLHQTRRKWPQVPIESTIIGASTFINALQKHEGIKNLDPHIRLLIITREHCNWILSQHSDKSCGQTYFQLVENCECLSSVFRVLGTNIRERLSFDYISPSEPTFSVTIATWGNSPYNTFLHASIPVTQRQHCWLAVELSSARAPV